MKKALTLGWTLALLVFIPRVHGQTGSPSFRLDVMAVLSKAGCNAGACHGNQNGKGGFRLSLRGQEPGEDHAVLTKEYGGRRLNLLDPAQSLLLLKPTGRVAHEGGVRFSEDASAYRILHDWIASGAPDTKSADPQLVELHVQSTPAESVVMAKRPASGQSSGASSEPSEPHSVEASDTDARPGETRYEFPAVKLTVVAHFDDGSHRDVTTLSVYESSALNATVSPGGEIHGIRPGESTIVVRYLNRQVALPFAFIPYHSELNDVDQAPETLAEAADDSSHNFIDDRIEAKLARLRMSPSAICDDSTFVRRAYLDTLGLLPTAEEAKAFVADSHPDKRLRLIDHLLARPEFADYSALKWADLLRVEEKVLDSRGVEAFHGWIRDWIAKDRSLDQFVVRLLTTGGSTYDNPAANFYRANRDASTRGETAARLFLGYRLQCAKCHNHPFDRWTQDDYYDWTTLFSRIDYKIVKNDRKDKFDKNEFVGEQIVLFKDSGEVKNPRSGRPAEARVLGGPRVTSQADRTEVPPAPEASGSRPPRLEQMADWLTSKDNHQFAQVQTNWVWYHLMGRGLVEPIDDFRVTNPPSHPQLLEQLSQEFQRGDYRLRPLIRQIMLSRAYQRSPEPNASNAYTDANFARATVRRLPAEVLLDTQTQVLGAPAEFAGYETGRRAVSLPGVSKGGRRVPRESGDRFLTTFGKPQRLLACECERSDETTLAQALLLIGGESLHDRLQTNDNRIAGLARSEASFEELVDELYWSALTRSPTSKELRGAKSLLDQNSDRVATLQDIAWALLNSKEFLFRH